MPYSKYYKTGKMFQAVLLLVLFSYSSQSLAVVDLNRLSQIDAYGEAVTGGIYDRLTGNTTDTYTLTNLGSESLAGPIYIVISDIVTAGSGDVVTVVNPDDTTVGGDPVKVIMLDQWEPGASFSYDLILNNTGRGGFEYRQSVFYDAGDVTPPEIVAFVDPPPNAAGWHNEPVTVSFDCSSNSGVASCSPAVTVVAEGAGQIITGEVVDTAGNRATIDVTLNIDRTPPELVVANPVDGSIVDNTTPQIVVNYSDVLSGLDIATYTTAIDGSDFTAAFTINPDSATYVANLSPTVHSVDAAIADIAGNQAQVTSTFTISVFRAIPDCSPDSGPVPLIVRFRTNGEYSSGSIVRYRWDFNGDGTFDSSDTVPRDFTRTISQIGITIAVLEVLNNIGEIATASCEINVQGNIPSATASVSPSNGPIPLDANFTCTGSDPDGQIVLYEWDFDGDGVFDFSSPTSGSTSFTYTEEGEFEAVCRVTDDDGFSTEARTTTTVIRSGPVGSPTVQATASPASGNAPLNVFFNGTATDDGSIELWEWDFDGDGVFDFSSIISAATSFRYETGGIFAPALRVTDNDGLTAIDNVEVVVNLTADLDIPSDTFDPSLGASVRIDTLLSAGVPMRLLLGDDAGFPVRTLADEFREAGSYSDLWDGRDDAGNLLPQGVYFAVLEYDFGGEVRSVDFTNTTGGTRYSPTRSRFPRTFTPFADDLLDINFTIPASRGASEVIAFIGLFRSNTRFVTLVERVPFGVGAHTLFWNGLDQEGNVAVPPPGDTFLFGVFGFTLPDNAIMLQSAPVLSNVSVDPNFFDPSTPPELIDPADAVATITYDLDKESDVLLTVTNLETGRILRRVVELNVSAGTQTLAWDGLAEDGRFADRGEYRLSLSATDAAGGESITRFALVRINY